MKSSDKYNDPHFPHGVKCLFMNGVAHQTHNNWVKEDDRFYWRRAQDHYRDLGLKPVLFDSAVDPNDIIQGKLADCYFLAALASLAEPEAGKSLGDRVSDNFLIDEYN